MFLFSNLSIQNVKWKSAVDLILFSFPMSSQNELWRRNMGKFEAKHKLFPATNNRYCYLSILHLLLKIASWYKVGETRIV